MIKVYTDGSCLGNPGAGGWAAVIIDEKNQHEEIFGGEEYTTNNRMELTAAIRALEKISEGAEVELFTDSSYLKNAFTNGWLANWKRNGWNSVRVRNQDLWRELDELVATRVVNFNWVKSHAGIFFNERCDKLAQMTAEKFQRGELKNSPPKKFSMPQKISSPPKNLPPAKNLSRGQLSLFDF